MTAAAHLDLAWLDKLHRETEGDPPPTGAVTAQQYAERFGISIDTATQRLRRLAESGKLQAGQFMAKARDGKGRRSRYYWPAR